MNTDSQIRNIDPSSAIHFPCWLWRKGDHGHWQHFKAPTSTLDWLGDYSHIHPDQPETPASIPAVEELRRQQKGGSETPRTDKAANSGGFQTLNLADVARELERENANLRKALTDVMACLREGWIPEHVYHDAREALKHP